MEFDYAATKLKLLAKRCPQRLASPKAPIEVKNLQQYRQQQLKKKN